MRRLARNRTSGLHRRHDRLSSLGPRGRLLLFGAHHQALPSPKRNLWTIDSNRLNVPPVPRLRALGHGGEGIFVGEGANELGPFAGKRILLEQTKQGWRSLKQARQEINEPWVL